MKKVLMLLLTSSCLRLVLAQEANPNPAFPIATDRPTFADSPILVPVGHPQIESGFTVTTVQGVRTLTFPEIIYRQALTDHFELRLVNGTFASVSGGGSPATTGLQDPFVGFKWKFLDGVYTGKTRRPDLGLEVVTSLPIGARAFRVNTSQPSAKFMLQYNTDPNTQVGGNLIISSVGAGDQSFGQFATSVYASHNVDPKTAFFAEVYSFFPEIKNGPNASFADVGVTYLLNQRTQVDFRVGTGFDERRDGTFMGAGLSYRF